MAKYLYIVRRKQVTRQCMDPSEAPANFHIEATFAAHGEARAYHRRREEEEAERGNPTPLYELLYTEGGEGLRALSDFEPGVFDDWLSDHDIPDPETIWDEYGGEQDAVGAYLEALGPDKIRHLYAALHRFRFFEIVQVPLVIGDYPPERREPWENELPTSPPPPTAPAPTVDQTALQETLLRLRHVFLGTEQPPPFPEEEEDIPF